MMTHPLPGQAIGFLHVSADRLYNSSAVHAYRIGEIIMSVNLIDRLKQSGLENFVPADLRITDSGDYYGPDDDNNMPLFDGIGSENMRSDEMSQSARLRAEYDTYAEEEDRYLNVVKMAAYRDQDEEDEIEGKYAPDHEEEENGIRTLYDLKELFHFEYLSDDEFLNLKISDLFRTTDHELRFFDIKLLSDMSIDRYIMLMQDKRIKERFPAPEKRIRYCQMEAVTDTRGLASRMHIYHTDKYNDFYRYILDNHSEKFLQDNSKLCREQAESDSEINRFTEKIILNQKPERAFYLLNLYTDYIIMYPYALYRNLERHRAGEDDDMIHYTLYPKVSHLKDLHDKAMRDYNAVRSEVQKKDHDHTNEMIAIQVNTPGYKRFLYASDGYVVKAPQCLEDFENEGKVLNHCVASYITSVASGDTRIFFIRHADRPDEPFYTAEVKDDDNGRWCLTQCYTKDDTTLKSYKTEQFIRRWCRDRQISIRCRL